MDALQTCPVCHQPAEPTDYFCRNCGKNLREAPPSTGPGRQFVIYAVSLLAPPFGIVYGIRYLRRPDTASRAIGLAATILTVVSSIAVTVYTIKVVNGINAAVNTQMQQFSGF
jgi:hypothetical protein